MDALSTWLQELGLERYTTIFAESDVDLEALRLPTDAELEKLGVSLGHRKKRLKAIERNGSEARAPIALAIQAGPPAQESLRVELASASHGSRVCSENAFAKNSTRSGAFSARPIT